MISLEEYRLQVIERLKACTHAAQARNVLTEVDVSVSSCGMSLKARKTFWEALSSNLDVIAQESSGLLPRQSAAVLRVVLVEAQSAIALYYLVLAREEERTTG